MVFLFSLRTQCCYRPNRDSAKHIFAHVSAACSLFFEPCGGLVMLNSLGLRSTYLICTCSCHSIGPSEHRHIAYPLRVPLHVHYLVDLQDILSTDRNYSTRFRCREGGKRRGWDNARHSIKEVFLHTTTVYGKACAMCIRRTPSWRCLSSSDSPSNLSVQTSHSPLPLSLLLFSLAPHSSFFRCILLHHASL